MNKWIKLNPIAEVVYMFPGSNDDLVISNPLWYREETVDGKSFEFFIDTSGACYQIPSGWMCKRSVSNRKDIAEIVKYEPWWEIVKKDGTRG